MLVRRLAAAAFLSLLVPDTSFADWSRNLEGRTLTIELDTDEDLDLTIVNLVSSETPSGAFLRVKEYRNGVLVDDESRLFDDIRDVNITTSDTCRLHIRATRFFDVTARGSNLGDRFSGVYEAWGRMGSDVFEDCFLVYGGAGNDVIHAREAPEPTFLGTIARGGTGNDWMIGSSSQDIFYGGPGNDVLFGFGGIDELRGGSGADSIYAGEGDDRVDGGDATARPAIAGGNDDFLQSNSGSDRIWRYTVGGRAIRPLHDFSTGDRWVDVALPSPLLIFPWRASGMFSAF